jgi:hypothetical protein
LLDVALILKRWAKNTVLSFVFTWAVHSCYVQSTSKPCGHSVLKMLTQFKGPYTSPRKQWPLCSSMRQGCICLPFCVRSRRRTQRALRSRSYHPWSRSALQRERHYARENARSF